MEKKKLPLQLKVFAGIIMILMILGIAGYGFIEGRLDKIHQVDPGEVEPVEQKEETFAEEWEQAEASEEVPEMEPEEITWPDLNEDIMKDKEVANIMLIGQDRRAGQGRQRSDSMIMVTINKKQKKIQLTSFMRDLYVQIPGYSDNRMNAAYCFGGMELLDQVIETNFGIRIDGNVEVDFNGFQSCIDLLGGIDMELSQAEADYICGRDQTVLYPQPLREDWNLKEGINHLNGEQALTHARNRSVGNSDYERTNRQREVLLAAFEKVKDSDMNTMLKLMDEGFSLLTTDLSHGDLMGYAMSVMTMGVDTAESYRIPQDGAYKPAVIRQMQVLVPDLEKCRKSLQDNLYGTE